MNALMEKPEVALAAIEYDKAYNFQAQNSPETATLAARIMTAGFLKTKHGYQDADAAIEAIEEFRKRKSTAQVAQPQPAQSVPTPGPAQNSGVSAQNAEAEADAPAEQTPQAEFVDSLPNVPAPMKAARQWVRHSKKVPHQVNGAKASSTDPNTWTDYQTATKSAFGDGAGFVFANGFAGIDLDGCRDKVTGEVTPWADAIIEKLDDAYVEISPSGTGLHVFVRGKVPGKDYMFKLDPAIGYGKAAVEIYDKERYFTVTGNPLFEDVGDIHDCDLTEVYEMFHKLRQDHPVPKSARELAADVCEGTPIELLGTFQTTKFDIFSEGHIESQSPFVISNRVGRLTYPSQSEADMGFCTVLAIHFDGDEQKVDAAMRQSPLYRPKWERKDYREGTIAKAIVTAAKVRANSAPQVPVITIPANAAPLVPLEDNTGMIPPFDPSVVNGIYKKFVDVATAGTTLAPQFIYAIAKTVVGARMAGKVHFENLDVEPRFYTALIGETGSGKGEAWRRVFQILCADAQMGNMAGGIKIINSADSGAGIRDVFFEPPQENPVLMYIDEVASLGNKSATTKQPEILDRLIELADSTQISRVKASTKNNKAAISKNDARLCAVMCGQDGNVYMAAFAGKTKLGLWDRLSPEYGEPVEAGNLPRINPTEALQVMQAFSALQFHGELTMALDARGRIEQFWDAQPVGVKKKARWRKMLWLEAYMSAFGRGSRVAELEDVEIGIKIFTRQLVIRQVHFSDEVPDRTGYYLGLIKKITESMRRQLAAGHPQHQVALSRRDYERKTNAARDNEEHIFERAWAIHSKTHLWAVEITKTNGQKYVKWLPIPEEE